MFDIARLNLASQWHTPSLGEIAELLVFYDQVHIRAPWVRINELLPREVDDVAFFRALVDSGKISIVVDQTPLGEVAFEMGLLGNFLRDVVDPLETRERLRNAYLENPHPPLGSILARDADYERRWISHWEGIIDACVNPVTKDPRYIDAIIDNAIKKISLIGEPDFLTSALESYGSNSSPAVCKALSDLSTQPVEFEGLATTEFMTKPFETSAEILQFLSQADALLDHVDTGDGLDDYTFPDFDAWTHLLLRKSIRRVGVREDLEAFQTSVLGSSRISTAIDANARSFRELEQLLERREPFARAVRGRPVDQSLAQAYFEEIKNTSWLTRGAGKVVRFSLFTGAGIVTGALLTPVVGGVVGVGLNALDNFVLDKLIKGNACRSFVEGDLIRFASE
jgi:hypothetical protein